MTTVAIIIQPLIAAFTGWFTIRAARYLLFHPREPRHFLGTTIQGIFPKRQKQFAAKLGSTVATELLHFNDIAAQIKEPSQLASLMPGIEAHIDAFLQTRLKERIPVLAMFLSDSILQQVKSGLMEEIQAMLPDVIGQFADSLSSKIDVARTVSDKVASFSSDRLETLLMTKEFRFVELLGGALGFIIGLIQMGLSLWL